MVIGASAVARALGDAGLGGRVHAIHQEGQVVGKRNRVVYWRGPGEFLRELAEPLADPLDGCAREAEVRQDRAGGSVLVVEA